MGKKLTIGIVFAIGFAYMLYVPFPDGPFPWQMRLGAGMNKVMEKLGRLNVMLGGSFAAPYRILTMKIPSNVSGIEIIDLELGSVPVTIFRPQEFAKNGAGPAIIYYHGGGWTIGSVAQYATQIIQIARKTGMLVVVPEYRLAPEHPFPAAYDDCLEVAEVFLSKAKEYDVNPKKVVLSGDSAGGNLAIAVALELGIREKGKKNPICMANPIYPALQFGDFRLPSYLQNAYMPILSRDAVANFFLNYVGLGSNIELIPMLISNAHMNGFDNAVQKDRISKKWIPKKYKSREEIDDRDLILPNEGVESLLKHRKKILDAITDRRMAPLAVGDSDLKALPRTHIIACEYDVLRDDAVILHERMKSLGLEVSLDHWKFAIHAVVSGYGFFSYDRLDKAMDKMFETIISGVEQC